MACIKEFCKENLKTYINRTFRIVNGTASREDLKSILIHICYSSHMLLTYDERKQNQSFKVTRM